MPLRHVLMIKTLVYFVTETYPLFRNTMFKQVSIMNGDGNSC